MSINNSTAAKSRTIEDLRATSTPVRDTPWHTDELQAAAERSRCRSLTVEPDSEPPY